MSTHSLRELRDNLGTVVRKVAFTGEEALITDAGKDAAVIVSMADYERLHEHADIADAVWLRDIRKTDVTSVSLADMLAQLGVSLEDFTTGSAA